MGGREDRASLGEPMLLPIVGARLGNIFFYCFSVDVTFAKE